MLPKHIRTSRKVKALGGFAKKNRDPETAWSKLKSRLRSETVLTDEIRDSKMPRIAQNTSQRDCETLIIQLQFGEPPNFW